MILFYQISISGIVNTMNKLNNLTKAQQISIIVVSGLLIAVTLYGTVAFTMRLWPFNPATTTRVAPPAAKNPAISMEAPKLNPETKVLQANAKVLTTEQGTCKLTMTKGDIVYTFTNSTEGLQDKKGCLDWNVGTENMEAGKYALEIKFMGKTQTASVKQTVMIP